jgi:hypothetical protein
MRRPPQADAEVPVLKQPLRTGLKKDGLERITLPHKVV